MSNPDKCTAGLTFGVRFKLDDAANDYKDEPHYIVDSGGSSKESRGFTLFLKDGKLYAVVSVPDEVWRVGLYCDMLLCRSSSMRFHAGTRSYIQHFQFCRTLLILALSWLRVVSLTSAVSSVIPVMITQTAITRNRCQMIRSLQPVYELVILRYFVIP